MTGLMEVDLCAMISMNVILEFMNVKRTQYVTMRMELLSVKMLQFAT